MVGETLVIFDVCVVGTELSGLIAAAAALRDQKRVLLIPTPGLQADDGYIPFFQSTQNDIWQRFFRHLGTSPEPWVLKSEGDPAWTFLASGVSLTFRHSSRAKNLLMPHNQVLGHGFHEFFEGLMSYTLEDETFLAQLLWPELTQSESSSLTLSEVSDWRSKHLLPHCPPRNCQETELLVSLLSPLFRLTEGESNRSETHLPPLYQLCLPQSHRLPLGSRSLTPWLIRTIGLLGGRVLPGARLMEILIDRGEARGVVCSSPHGALFAKHLILNTFDRCLEKAIPVLCRKEMQFGEVYFVERDLAFEYTKLPDLPLDSRVRPFVGIPLIGTEDLNCPELREASFYGLEGEPGSPHLKCKFPLRNNQVLQNRALASGPPPFSKGPVGKVSVHRSGLTRFPNVRYAQQFLACELGIIGHLLEGLCLRNWLKTPH
jgi:hypothetical protein